MKQIFEDIASANSWAFDYGRQDFRNLADSEALNEDESKRYYLFCDPVEGNQLFSRAGLPMGQTEYTGKLMLLVASDLDQVYDAQLDSNKDNGKYESNIKPMIAKGGPLDLMLDSLICDYDLEVQVWRITEVINMLDMNMDGVIINYKMKRYL